MDTGYSASGWIDLPIPPLVFPPLYRRRQSTYLPQQRLSDNLYFRFLIVSILLIHLVVQLGLK
ncbi:hypothetical protein C1645_832388 [Glomus cerebriforme]|uniref:Uncharacterized protein n=1 Tax=Glomus cerebriforme TaxID=658196 RepID=A0A397SDN0_9GLOM|nr:hypothetical protein C1645_832388 [Glomus cerebriforme]